MGLDMYLSKRTWVGNQYVDEDGRQIKVAITATGDVSRIKEERITEVTEQVGYWRKANAIHGWFVKNVQGGSDDCEEYPVSREQLEELLDLCKRIRGDKKKPKLNVEIAKKELPTVEGFFFGSTDYNEDYLADIEETIAILTAVLEDEDWEELYYQSSW